MAGFLQRATATRDLLLGWPWHRAHAPPHVHSFLCSDPHERVHSGILRCADPPPHAIPPPPASLSQAFSPGRLRMQRRSSQTQNPCQFDHGASNSMKSGEVRQRAAAENELRRSAPPPPRADEPGPPDPQPTRRIRSAYRCAQNRQI